MKRLDFKALYGLSSLLDALDLPSGLVDAWQKDDTTIIATVTNDFASTDSITLTITITQDGP